MKLSRVAGVLKSRLVPVGSTLFHQGWHLTRGAVEAGTNYATKSLIPVTSNVLQRGWQMTNDIRSNYAKALVEAGTDYATKNLIPVTSSILQRGWQMTNDIRSNYAKALVLVSSNGKDKILSGILEHLDVLEAENEVYGDFLEKLEQQGFVEWHDTKHSTSHAPQLPKLKLGPVLDRVAKKNGLNKPEGGDVNQGDSGQIRWLKGELINLMLEKRELMRDFHNSQASMFQELSIAKYPEHPGEKLPMPVRSGH